MRADVGLRSWGLLGFQFGVRAVPAPLLVMFALMIRGSGWWVVALVAVVVSIVLSVGFGAMFTTSLTEDGVDLSGPRLRRRLQVTDVTALHLGRPYGQAAGYDTDSVGCAVSVELTNGARWLLPGGLIWRRSSVAPSVVAWAEHHGIAVVDDPRRTAPPFVRSLRAWYAGPPARA